MLANQTLAP